MKKFSLSVLICTGLSLAAPTKSNTSTSKTGTPAMAPILTTTEPTPFTRNDFSFTKQSANKNFMLLDFIGATQGFTNLNLEFKISDQLSATG